MCEPKAAGTLGDSSPEPISRSSIALPPVSPTPISKHILILPNVPSRRHRVQRIAIAVISSPVFQATSVLVIMANIVSLSLVYDYGDGMPADYQNTLALLELIFVCFFAVELLITMCTFYNPLRFFIRGFNLFEAGIILMSIIALLFNNVPNLSVLRLIKVCRMMQTMRLLRRMPELRRVLKSVFASASTLLLLFGVLCLNTGLFALLAMQLFGGELGTGVDRPRHHFDSFFQSMMTLFEVLTLEDWTDIMNDCLNSPNSSWAAIPFFLAYIVVSVYILLNLFVAVTLENFGMEDDLKMENQRAEHEKKSMDQQTIELLGVVWSVRKVSKVAKSLEGIQKQFDESNVLKRPNQKSIISVFQPSESIADMTSDYSPSPGSVASSETESTPDFNPDNMDKQTIAEQASVMKRLAERVKIHRNSIWDAAAEIWCCLPSKHQARQICRSVILNKNFDKMIIATIIGSSIILAMDSPGPKDAGMSQFFFIADLVFFVIFAFEFLFRTIGMGWFGYYADGWNRLDFVVLVITALNLIPGLSLAWGRVLRLGRTIKPLRMMNKNPEMKHVVNALGSALKPMFNVVVLALILTMLYGLLGVDLFAGLLFTCNDISMDKSECIGYYTVAGNFTTPRSWEALPGNFNDLSEGVFTLFEVSTLENWRTIMYSVIDATSKGQAPQINHEQSRILFFITYIIFITFFTFNLFIGVLVDHFRKSSGSAFLTDSQRLWMDMKRLTLLLKPDRVAVRPDKPWRKAVWKIVVSPKFDIVISTLICLNVAVMASETSSQSDQVHDILFLINIGFLVLFWIEMILKLVAVGPRVYVADLWNCFDGLVCIGSAVLILLFPGATGAQAVRAFRLLRIIRIVKRAKGIKLVLNTLILSMPALGNISGLLFLLFFVFAVVGMTIFGEVKYGVALNEFNNFRNFGNAMSALFRFSTAYETVVITDAAIEYPNCTLGDNSDCGSIVLARIFFPVFMVV